MTSDFLSNTCYFLHKAIEYWHNYPTLMISALLAVGKLNGNSLVSFYFWQRKIKNNSTACIEL